MTTKTEMTTSQQPMMGSKEFAKLTEKTVGNVNADIWNMLDQLCTVKKDDWDFNHHKNHEVKIINGISAVIDGRGYVSEFLLDRRHTEILITGYDVKRRAAVIDRWFALESGSSKPAVISRKELALMVIEAEDRAELLALENNALAATVGSLEKHFTKGMTIPAFCKGLNGVNVSKMMWWACERGWVYNSRRDPEKSPKWRVASYARDKYLTEEKTDITPHGMDQFEKYTAVLLEKGCHRLYQLYMKGELPMKKTWNGEFSHDKAIYAPEATV